jgi:hypothetical protein
MYNRQSVQLRNNGFWVLEGVGNCQSLQNIIITILYHEHFSHGTSTFNRNSVLNAIVSNYWHDHSKCNELNTIMRQNDVMFIIILNRFRRVIRTIENIDIINKSC